MQTARSLTIIDELGRTTSFFERWHGHFYQIFTWIIKWRWHSVEQRARPLTTHRERQCSVEDLGAIVAPIPHERSAMAFLDEVKDPRATHNELNNALLVDTVALELVDLQTELCPSHMSEQCFRKIYFVLLHLKRLRGK
ncbi:unnamed protein product [Urochloa humidicola]